MSERTGGRVSVRAGAAPRDGVVRGAFAWLLLWTSLARYGQPAGHELPEPGYRSRSSYSANHLTLLPVGTIFIQHVLHQRGFIQDDLIWQVFRTGRARLLSHNSFSTEDLDAFEAADITILAVVPEHVLATRDLSH